MEVWLSIARQLLTMIGTYIVASGWMTGEQWSSLIGAGLAFFSVVWSVVASHNKTQQVQQLKVEVKEAKQETAAAKMGSM